MIYKLFKILSLINFLIFFNTGQIFAQWVPETGVPNSEIYSIKSFDGQFIYAGGDFCFIRSMNGGLTWDSIPMVDAQGGFIPAAIMKSVHFTSATEGIATGSFFLGNDVVIFKTTNGGLNWTPVYLNSNGGLPRYLNKLFFINSLTGWSVGTDGRILKTTNGGSNWTAQSSGTSSTLEDVYFTSTSAGVAVGEEVILRTTNGGTSWSSQTFSNIYFNAVHFPSSSTGFAAGDNNKLYKTTNGGTNWTQIAINVPESFNISHVYFSSVSTGYITTGSGPGEGMILKTTDGGLHWSKFNTSNRTGFISFRNLTDGWACGENGSIFHTTTTGDPYTPISMFELSPSIVCQDSIIVLNNLSTPGATYAWYLNNQLISTNYNTTLQINNAGQSDTLSLITSSGILTDTFSSVIQIQPTLQIPVINAAAVNDSVCKGQPAQFIVQNSQSGTTYSLKINNTTIGSPQNGNGNNLVFNSSAVNANTVFTIFASRTVNGCGNSTRNKNISVSLSNPDSTLNVAPLSINICKNDSFNITLSNSKLNVTYQLKKGTTNVGIALQGTGGLLTFPTGQNSTSAIYSISATNLFGCSSTMINKVSVAVELINSQFGLSNCNPEVGEPIFTMNSTSNPGGTYLWNFGPFASSPTSWLPNISSVSFSTPGIYSVHLISTTPSGCIDTLTRPVTVLSSLPYNDCRISMVTRITGQGTLECVGADPTDNGYVSMYEADNADVFLAYSTHGDTLRDYHTYVPQSQFENGYFITKFNSKGVPIWTSKIFHGESFINPGDVVIDTLGNIYCSYRSLQAIDSVKVISSDSTFVTFKPALSNGIPPVLVIKFNNSGIYQWHRYNYSGVSDPSSLKLDTHQNIYSLNMSKLSKWDSQGQFAWVINSNITQGGYMDFVIDTLDNVHIVNQDGLSIETYDSSGIFVSATPKITAAFTPLAAKMEMDVSGNKYISGEINGDFVFNGDTISSYLPENDFFILKMGPSGQHLWLKQFRSKTANSIYGHAIKNGLVMVGVLSRGDTIWFDNLPPISGVNPFFYVYVCDTAGNPVAAQKIFEVATSTGDYIIDFNRFTYGINNDEIIFGFKHNAPLIFGGDTIIPYYGSSPNTNFCIAKGNIGCFIPGLGSNFTPNSFFTSATDTICTGQTVQFTDLSDHSPSSWNWSLTGSTQSNSTTQNPVVTYNTPGSYTVTLAASNSNGTGSTYSRNIVVISTPSIQISGSTSSCSGQPVTLTASGAQNYYWNNAATTNSIVVAPLVTTAFSVTATLSVCSATSTHIINVLPLPVATVSTNDPINICLGDTVHLSANAGMTSYQWYRGNNPVAGAVNIDFAATLSGLYKCKVTGSNNCENFSNAIRVRIICLPPSNPVQREIINNTGNESEFIVKVHPNPSNSEFNIATNCNEFSSIEIYTIAGAVTGEIIVIPESSEYIISNLDAGIYFASVRCGNRQKTVKLICTK